MWINEKKQAIWDERLRERDIHLKMEKNIDEFKNGKE
jgi:hypothetical protein|tara:strand:+ start:181 stop:291 length:111 start_codon:yes stop_codon:yes gene_type:complete